MSVRMKVSVKFMHVLAEQASVGGGRRQGFEHWASVSDTQRGIKKKEGMIAWLASVNKQKLTGKLFC